MTTAPPHMPPEMMARAKTLTELELLTGTGPLVVHRLPGTTRQMVVSFAGVGLKSKEVPAPEFVGIASNHGRNHALFITDPARTWLNGDEVVETMIEIIEDHRFRQGIERLVFLGNSMGGFSALKLADLMKVDVAIAFAPQFSAHPEVVPEENRWRGYIKRIRKWRYRDVGPLEREGTSYYSFHGVNELEDPHWRRFPSPKGLQHFIVGGAGHSLAAVLRKRGYLGEVIAAAIANKPRSVRQALEKPFLSCGLIVARRRNYERMHPAGALFTEEAT